MGIGGKCQIRRGTTPTPTPGLTSSFSSSAHPPHLALLTSLLHSPKSWWQDVIPVPNYFLTSGLQITPEISLTSQRPGKQLLCPEEGKMPVPPQPMQSQLEHMFPGPWPPPSKDRCVLEVCSLWAHRCRSVVFLRFYHKPSWNFFFNDKV